ncbi:MAG: HRDC domain-containing protein [Verrucomicrobiales bacterium]
MGGAGEFSIRWPRLAAPRRSGREGDGGGEAPGEALLEELGFDAGLFERLKAKRKQLAQAVGNVPPYVIFSNATLEFFTRLRPTTVEAAMRIRGVGKVKAERYLEDFLEVIREWGE